MPNRGKQECEEHEEARNVLSNKRGCPRRTNVSLDQMSIVPLDWTMDNTDARMNM